MNFLFFLQI